MNNKKKEKYFWKKYFNFPDRLEEIPYAIEHINLRCTEVDDEDLEYLVSRIMLIEMLDLDETSVSNNGIKQLIKLKGLKELRLKDNYPINNDCIPDLNKMTGLELLHLGSTSITIDGILQLNALQSLKRLLFSMENIENNGEKMLQLKSLLPHCEFIINNKLYNFDEDTISFYSV